MACGKPIVACNRGGVPEIVGRAGFLIEPIVRQWQETVGKLMSSRALRREMGNQAAERSKSFSWEKTTSNLLRAFGNLETTGKIPADVC